MATFPERLKKLRAERKLSQEQLGAVIGVSKYAVHLYEKGKTCPEMKGLMGLAEYFDVSLDYLAGRTSKRDINR